ncbi:MAG: tRNA (adenosine(37)-N6)-dimethylallyltransferase MiaA [Gudongella sp.]|nr:tRNA (adenosine(37)-N6)-dimethylallyltransferase MiaA [Gudongella sp.]
MKEKLIVITGPTAVGKTSISISLAKRLDGEIISADSMQIYKYMDIGTAKVTEAEMDGIRHHMVDFIKPDQQFTVADYKENATKIIHSLNKQGKLPIIAGGTGLYINSLAYELNFVDVPPNQKLRDELEAYAEDFGNLALLDKLQGIDPVAASKYTENDIQRIVRAIEITTISGKTYDEYGSNFRAPNHSYDLLMYCLNMDRQKLYERINHRVDIMLQQGLVQEVQSLMDMGYGKDLVSMKAIGYKEIMEYLEGNESYPDTVEKIKKLSRNYAKRQLTWFRRDDRVNWIDVEDYDSMNAIVDHLERDIRKKIY